MIVRSFSIRRASRLVNTKDVEIAVSYYNYSYNYSYLHFLAVTFVPILWSMYFLAKNREDSYSTYPKFYRFANA